MSGRRWAAGLVVAATLPVQAFDWAAPFTDPLYTLPPVIEAGATLPGDREPVPCPVQKDFGEPLILAEAVDLALCNNPQIKAAWAAIKVQAGALGEARAAYLPTLSATNSDLRTRTAYPGSPITTATTHGQTVYATLAWRLFDFGGRAANADAADSLLAAALASHDGAMQKILGETIQAYFDAQAAKGLLAAKDQSKAVAERTLDSARRKEARGAASHSDTLQAATALAKASLDMNRAAGSYRKALAVLVYALGVAPQTQPTLADDLSDQAASGAKNLKEWLAVAEQGHPAIRAARAQWAAAKQRIVATRSEGLPTLDFSANYYENGYPGQGISANQSRISTLGLTLTIPLFDGFSRTYKIRGAQAQAEQREAELRDTEHSVLMEVVKTYADATASLQDLTASENLLGAAQESLNASRRRYDKGAADIVELLNSQAALADAEQERVRALAEWRSARLRLLTSSGTMGRGALRP